MRRAASLAVAAAALVGSGCGNDESPAVADGSVITRPGCERSAPASAGAAPAGLHLPRARLVIGPSRPRENDRQITIVNGYIEIDPAQLAQVFRSRPELTILFDENDGFDAEVMVTDGRTRNFWKAVRRCKGGSSFTVTLAPELAAEN